MPVIGYNGGVGHGVVRHDNPTVQLDGDTAKIVATIFGALATPSRLQILTKLRHGPCSVSDLSAAVGMEQSAVSHQLRLLRNLGLVNGNRAGRNVVYGLYDNHIAELLDQAIYHVDHRRLGYPDRTTTVS